MSILSALDEVLAIGVPLLVLCWALLLLTFREAALLALGTAMLVPVLGPWIIVFNAIGFVAIRAMCRPIGGN
jgi:hypothetical protein